MWCISQHDTPIYSYRSALSMVIYPYTCHDHEVWHVRAIDVYYLWVVCYQWIIAMIDHIGMNERWGERFRNTYELLNLRALKFRLCIKIVFFSVWVWYFVWNFKSSLWNSTQNILPIHWEMWILSTGKILRALRFKGWQVVLKCTPGANTTKWVRAQDSNLQRF